MEELTHRLDGRWANVSRIDVVRPDSLHFLQDGFSEPAPVVVRAELHKGAQIPCELVGARFLVAERIPERGRVKVFPIAAPVQQAAFLQREISQRCRAWERH